MVRIDSMPHLRERKEVALPITIATMTTIAVFAPLGFIGGIVSEFFLPFALVITYALLASLLVALTAVPTLASFLIKRHSSDTAEEVLSRRIIRIYTPIVTWALGHRLYTIIGAILLFVGSMSLLANIPIGFLPGSVQNVLSIEIDTPPTTPSDVVIDYLDEAEAHLEELRLAGEVEGVHIAGWRRLRIRRARRRADDDQHVGATGGRG